MTDRKPELLTPGEVAGLMRVDPRTVGRWAKDRKISSIKTPGGHRRYPADEVRQMIKKSYTPSHAAEVLEQLESILGDKP